MTTIPPGVGARVILRSLFVQGSWNYETLIGTGFAFTVLPVLRHLNPANAEALRSAIARHSSIFNSHPYLVTVAAGAVARLETDGIDPQIVERFKTALRGSLGSLGDQLVWSAWRPATALVALALLLAGAAWWVGVAVFLVTYNLLHLGLRIWGWRLGFTAGLEVGKALREAPLQRVAQHTAEAGAVLGGFACVVAAARALEGPRPDAAPLAAVAAVLVAGVWLGPRARTVFGAALAVVWIFALVWR